MPDQSLLRVIRFLRQSVWYEAVMTVIAGWVVYHGHTFTAVFPFLFALGSVFCVGLMLYTAQAAARSDLERFPYGTGRLQNISALLLAAMISVGAMIPFVQSVSSLINDEIRVVNMEEAALLLALSTAGNWYQSHRALTLFNLSPNPILESISQGYRTGFIRDFWSFVLIVVGLVLSEGRMQVLAYLDDMMAIVLTLYALYRLLPQVWGNFKPLADFPMPENEQVKVIGILTRHFDSYDTVGQLFSTYRGDTRILEVELTFRPDIRLSEVIDLETAMLKEFQAIYPGGVFKIIARQGVPEPTSVASGQG
jgi:divalent metal cation (Fe/Co/Zn/Cd) transporter